MTLASTFNWSSVVRPRLDQGRAGARDHMRPVIGQRVQFAQHRPRLAGQRVADAVNTSFGGASDQSRAM